jgi:hypothetical protein
MSLAVGVKHLAAGLHAIRLTIKETFRVHRFVNHLQLIVIWLNYN